MDSFQCTQLPVAALRFLILISEQAILKLPTRWDTQLQIMGAPCLSFFSSPVTPCNQSVFDILSLLPPTLSSLSFLLFLLSSFISPYSQSPVQTPSFTVPPSHSKRGSCPAKEKKYESSPSTVTVYFEQPRDGAVNVNYSFPFGRKPSQENDM